MRDAGLPQRHRHLGKVQAMQSVQIVTDQQKRAYVAEMYPSANWKKKVAKMSDAQVFAIYMREQHKPHNNGPTHSEESNDDPPPF